MLVGLLAVGELAFPAVSRKKRHGLERVDGLRDGCETEQEEQGWQRGGAWDTSLDWPGRGR